MPASDKLFYWLFQEQPDRILQLLPDLPADASGYQFTAPVLKERECRLSRSVACGFCALALRSTKSGGHIRVQRCEVYRQRG